MFLQNNMHGFPSVLPVAIVIDSVSMTHCPLEVSPMCSKFYWLSCEIWHPYILPKCPCWLPFLCTKTWLLIPGPCLLLMLPDLHSMASSTIPFSTKTIYWKNCRRVVPERMCHHCCAVRSYRHPGGTEGHSVCLPSMSTNSHEPKIQRCVHFDCKMVKYETHTFF